MLLSRINSARREGKYSCRVVTKTKNLMRKRRAYSVDSSKFLACRLNFIQHFFLAHTRASLYRVTAFRATPFPTVKQISFYLLYQSSQKRLGPWRSSSLGRDYFNFKAEPLDRNETYDSSKDSWKKILEEIRSSFFPPSIGKFFHTAESRFTRKKKKKEGKKEKRRSRMENKYLRLDCAQLKTSSMEFARCIVSQDRREASLHHPGSALLPAPGFLSTLIYRKPSNQSLCALEDVDVVSNRTGS